MTPDPHIAFAAVHISLDASLRIAKLLSSRPVDTELIAEAVQIAHEADVKTRALLPPASPGLGTLDNGDPVRTPPQQVWRVVDGVAALWWFWPDTDSFGAMVGKHEHPAYAHAGALQPAPDPTRWIRALRGPAPSTAPTDRRLQVLARLVDVAGAAVGLEDFVASTRAEYPDVFADLDEHLRQVAQGVFTIEDFENAVRTLERNDTAPPAPSAGPNVARLAGAMDTLAPGWSVDEPLDPSIWSQTLDRAQVAALAGERPSLAVQTEPREAGWLRDLVEAAPPSEAERIASHVAAVAPGYREQARAWLDAEHADMVEDLAALMATVSAECCS